MTCLPESPLAVLIGFILQGASIHACVCIKSLQSCPTLRPYGLQPSRLFCLWDTDSPSKNTGVDCHYLLQGIFQMQGLNPCLRCLLHWRQVLCPQRHLGSPLVGHRSQKILERLSQDAIVLKCLLKVEKKTGKITSKSINFLKIKVNGNLFITSVQFSSVTRSCLTLCDPMNYSNPGFPGVHPNPCPLCW